ncbi:MAG: nucleotidyl transferase AbiEii/AbiGii toxin family protein [Candidatus Howiella sp.]|jgi:predicted nucleotidyltransferase component of viral defense system
MISSSRQLKDLIRNMSKDKKTEAHILMRNYMMERLLERISLSKYKNNFILKGGMLVAAMVGLDSRSTMDLDATVKGFDVSVDSVQNILSEIISVNIDDGVTFSVKSVSNIMDDAEYSGVRVSLDTTFDGMRTPLKVDISTGDVITPSAVRYRFKLMLENRSLAVWAYNLETVLAEKLETIIARGITNTRMRDFYDIHILGILQKDNINSEDLHAAILAVMKKRESEKLISDISLVLNEIEESKGMQNLWTNYRKSFSYASDIDWKTVMASVRLMINFANLKN